MDAAVGSALVFLAIAVWLSLRLWFGVRRARRLAAERRDEIMRVPASRVRDASREPLTFTKPAAKGFQKSTGGSAPW